ncbi:MAG: M23 family metallopeptidase [Roseburia sp.]|nr:M23 family metallopeptidase [Roseburia sp.]
MKNKTLRYRRHKKLKITYIKYTMLTLFCCLFFVQGYVPFEKEGDNFFHVTVNGVAVGDVGDAKEAEQLFIQARREVAQEDSELTFIKAELAVTGEEVLWGTVDAQEQVQSKMEQILRKGVQNTLHRSYTVKVNEYMVNLASADEVQALLQAAIDKYDTTGNFRVELVHDMAREFSILTAQVNGESKEAQQPEEGIDYLNAGVELALAGESESETPGELDFSDYAYGLLDMDFSEKVEIVEAYLPESQLTSLEAAIEEVVKEQETVGVYEVVSGDTLSEIAIRLDIPMDRIVEMNKDLLETENSPLHIGDKLVITVPEPELSVTRTEQNYYEESYDADIIYIDNDAWYTYETKVHQSPSAGFRRVVADEYYLNDKLVSRLILKEEVVMEAVPKIVERGTKIPPTYIKPISGGRKTSGFGRRARPTKGASTYHKGVDWAVPTGTAVYASCGGTVEKAGWGSGYGYVVYINHEDGRQTRYGHLSKVLVKAGQSVKQGEKIALSGNTGITSGPHLHFEILIGGRQVDPLSYLN